MRIDSLLCTGCELCTEIAPEISYDRDRITVTEQSLDAMAECPVGAIVWREPGDDETGDGVAGAGDGR